MTPPFGSRAYSNDSQSACMSGAPTKRFQKSGPLPPSPPWISTGAALEKMIRLSSTRTSEFERTGTDDFGRHLRNQGNRLQRHRLSQWHRAAPSRLPRPPRLDNRLPVSDDCRENQPFSAGGSRE